MDLQQYIFLGRRSLKYKMKHINIFMILSWFIIINGKLVLMSNLPHCNESFKTESLCKLTEYYNPSLSPNYPTDIQVYFNIIDVVNFDWSLNTMTLFIDLWLLWNETRITINDFNK